MSQSGQIQWTLAISHIHIHLFPPYFFPKSFLPSSSSFRPYKTSVDRNQHLHLILAIVTYSHRTILQFQSSQFKLRGNCYTAYLTRLHKVLSTLMKTEYNDWYELTYSRHVSMITFSTSDCYSIYNYYIPMNPRIPFLLTIDCTFALYLSITILLFRYCYFLYTTSQFFTDIPQSPLKHS